MFYAALTPLLPQYADDLDLSKAGAGCSAVCARRARRRDLRRPVGREVRRPPDGARRAARHGRDYDGVRVRRVDRGARPRALLPGLRELFSWTAGLAWLVAAAPPDRAAARRSARPWAQRSSGRCSGPCSAAWRRSSARAGVRERRRARGGPRRLGVADTGVPAGDAAAAASTVRGRGRPAGRGVDLVRRPAGVPVRTNAGSAAARRARPLGARDRRDVAGGGDVRGTDHARCRPRPTAADDSHRCAPACSAEP